MKVEVIVRRKSDIRDEPIQELNGKPVTKELCDTMWEKSDGRMDYDDGVRFTFEAKSVREIDMFLPFLNAYLNRRRTDRTRWLEKEVRVNGVLLPEFYRGMASGYEKAVAEAISLLKRGRGRNPSEKESQVRKILEDALPENQNWLK